MENNGAEKTDLELTKLRLEVKRLTSEYKENFIGLETEKLKLEINKLNLEIKILERQLIKEENE